MGNITLSIPEELLEKMRQFREIRWSEIARRAIEERVNDLEVLDSITSKSKLTLKDAEEISRRIKKSAHKRFVNESSN